jgi:hypothetical protein
MCPTEKVFARSECPRHPGDVDPYVFGIIRRRKDHMILVDTRNDANLQTDYLAYYPSNLIVAPI